MKKMREIIQRAVILVLLMTLLCGVAYPLFITGIAQLFWKEKANGSIIEVNEKKYGSRLLSQSFEGEQYLWGRNLNLNTEVFFDEEGNPQLYAEPSNLNTSSQEFKDFIKERKTKIENANGDKKSEEIPTDLLTGSGSGIDPHISYEAAIYQVERIAKNRNETKEKVEKVINQYTTNRFMGIFGEKIVNVLEVNLALDGILE